MNIIICGAGRVGYGIAKTLSAENNQVTVVDKSPSSIQSITSELDVRGIVGHGSHPSVLKNAGLEFADMLIAVTYSDEVNMIACQIAHSLYGTPVKIARVRAQDYLKASWRDLYAKENLPIDVIISPEIEIGKAVLRRLQTPGAFEVVPFADGDIRLIGITLGPDCPIANMPVQQLNDLFPDLKANIVGVRRDGQVFAPKPDDPLSEGDDVFFVVQTQSEARLFEILGDATDTAQNIVIIGGGNIGTYIASELESRAKTRIRIIEKDRAQAEAIADRLKSTVVLNGNALDEKLLDEAAVSRAQSIICVTNDDKTNILSGLMAKSMGARQVFSLINDPSFLSIRKSLGIDMVIDPRMTTVSSILRHVRKGRILDVFSIDNGLAEVVEGEVLETSPLSGKTVDDLSAIDGISFGALIRDNSLEQVTPQTRFKPHDRVVLFAERTASRTLENLFRVGAEYF